ncbi:Glutathione gamma-glutamylcysteinyltransferase 1 [Camellia lanceoleosa]|uniref:Glutathione gamma-glutamylcysteinyltransferase 1 n=1 Tax=Camellia lanceoleosa TaxID=1840588 RepID=A0ACC0EZV7_9ERIC|nr:Glutathione gamma-glutamylcysteinyltransferase 1 [Camellia lanceoleosa]
MVMNALAIDPGRKWKGPWRWFDESMLDCCEPLEKVKATGISFGKLVCLAHCSGARVEAFRTNQSTIDDFRRYMLISKLHREPSLLYTLSCKHESWISIATYLVDDVPCLLKSDDVKDIKNVLSVILSSIPSDFGEFIKWVAEVRRREEDGGQSLSQEEKGRLAVKEEVLKQVQETGLYRHVTEFLSSERSCCRAIPMAAHEDNLPDIAARVCCQGRCFLVSGTVVNGNGEHGVDVLVPSSQTEQSCCGCNPTDGTGMHPASNDVLTALLLALPPETWSGIKEEKLLQEICNLVSTKNLPTLLQEEVLHLRGQLQLLKRCQDGKKIYSLRLKVKHQQHRHRHRHQEAKGFSQILKGCNEEARVVFQSSKCCSKRRHVIRDGNGCF